MADNTTHDICFLVRVSTQCMRTFGQIMLCIIFSLQTKSVFLKDYVRKRNKYTWTLGGVQDTKAFDFAIHIFANERVGCKVWVNLKELNMRSPYQDHCSVCWLIWLYLDSLGFLWLDLG